MPKTVVLEQAGQKRVSGDGEGMEEQKTGAVKMYKSAKLLHHKIMVLAHKSFTEKPKRSNSTEQLLSRVN